MLLMVLTVGYLVFEYKAERVFEYQSIGLLGKELLLMQQEIFDFYDSYEDFDGI